MAAMEDGRPNEQSQFPRVGRPRKPPHEKRKKQQEATKWRDARRVYLGNSYDRWKKVKSRLGLKDCSLAWHLLEAHDSHCVECGRGADLGSDDDDTPRNFFPQLIKSIRRICLQYLTFQHTVEVVGLVCLEIDKGTKENFSIKELVNRPIGLRVEALTSKQTSSKDDFEIEVACDDDDDEDDDDDDDENLDEDDEDMSDDSNVESGTDVPDQYPSHFENESGNPYEDENPKGGNSPSADLDESSSNPNYSEPICDKTSSLNVSEGNGQSAKGDNSSLNVLPLTSMQDNPWLSSLRMITESAKIDIPSQMGEDSGQLRVGSHGYDSPLDMAVVKSEQRSECGDVVNAVESASEVNTVVPASFSQSIGRLASSLPLTPTVDTGTPGGDQQTSPIDLKVVKQEPVDKPQQDEVPAVPVPDSPERSIQLPARLYARHFPEYIPAKPPVPDPALNRPENPSPILTPDNTLSGKKRKFGCMEPVMNSHKKEVFHKEEYEVLEMTPFTDYAEFSRHCPTVLQRTFYRWKRRIKDEYIFLEQHPEMTYQEYLQYIPHAKENVFTFWKSLMKKGYLFGTGTASHLSAILSHKNDHDVRKSSPVPGSQTWDEENSHQVLKYMQKNLTAEYQDITKHFPNLPEHVFKIWKQKNLQAWKFLEQNFSLEYPVFSRCFPSVSEEVFNIWRQNVLRDSRSKIMNLQREAVSTAEHIQEAQKALWTSLISQRLAQEHSRFAANAGTWPNLAGGWLGEYPGFWGTALNLSTLSRVDPSQMSQIQRDVQHTESAKAASSSSSVNSDSSTRTDTSSGLPACKSRLEEDADSDYLSKSKKQNKAEFYHCLQNPDMDYTEISATHPSVSLRTFYRWKKEIKTALAFVQEVPECTFDIFHSYFPEIPKEIYLVWKKKINPGVQSQDSTGGFQSDQMERNVKEKQEMTDSDREPDVEGLKDDELRDENLNMKGDERSSRKVNLQEFLYLQQNPTIDFAGFTYQFPHISMRTFYRWRREIQDQINAIRRNPNISFSDMQKVYPDVSEQVLSVWKKVVKSERELMNGFDSQECDNESVNLSTQNKENVANDLNNIDPSQYIGHNKKLKLSSSQDISAAQSNKSPRNCDNGNANIYSPRTTGRTLMKTGRQEYCYLIQNPDIDLHSFLGMFPDMSPATFYRWRREMKAILDYMNSNPDAGYQDVVAEFPEVTQDMFSQWREKLKNSSELPGNEEQNPIKSLQALVNDGETYATKQGYHSEPGFMYLLENPGTSIVEFSKLYPSVAAGMFSRWKKLVKDWFSLLKVSADIDYQTFSFYCSEVPEHVFNKWKVLVQKKEEPVDDLSDAEVLSGVGHSVNSPEDWVLTKTRKVNQTEYLFFLMNPYMDYNEFAVTFPLISLRTFYRWRREIRESLEYLEQYPDVSYKAFFQVFPVVPEEVFNKWKELCTEQNRKVEVSSESLKRSLNYHVSDSENISNKTEDAVTASSTDEVHAQQSQTAKSNPILPANKALDIEEESMFSVDSPDPPGIVSSLSSSESLSAAVESICRSAGLPPLDQAVDDLAEHQTVSSASGNAGSSVLGGVAFPGMSAAQSRSLVSNLDTASSIQSQILKQEEVYDESSLSGKPDSYGSTTPPPTSTNLGGITFPGLSSVPSYMDSAAGLTSQMMKEESFFSPRARKQSREEYLFLQQNPSMDFQEFCSHYPTISLRTFYRWKREFRQSHEYMMGLHSSLQ